MASKKAWVHFEFEKSELETDESIWAVYHRWCLHHKIDRSPLEMQHRLHYFKRHAKWVYEVNNNKNKRNSVCLNHFGDGDVPCCCGRVRPDPRRTRPFFEFGEADLASAETVCALYKKWCLHEGAERSFEEMRRRFPVFKQNAEAIYEHNMVCPRSRLDLGAFGDHQASDPAWVRSFVNMIRRDKFKERLKYCLICFILVVAIFVTLLVVI